MVPVFDGTCAICEAGLPWGSRPSRPRTICHSKECAREASRYGARIVQARRARQPRVQPTEKHCPKCDEVKPLDGEHFYVLKRRPDGSIARYDAWCKPCRRAYARVEGKTAEQLEARRARHRESDRRRLARIASDPQRLEQKRAQWRANKRRQKQENPEQLRAQRARERQRIAADPQRREARNEYDRMRYRLKREQEGKPVNVRKSKAAPRGAGGYVPAAPLVHELKLWLARQEHGSEAALKSIGVEPRLYRRWKSGESRHARFMEADAVLVGIGLSWRDVWTEPEDRAKAELLWEGPPRKPRLGPTDPWPRGEPVPDVIGEARRKGTLPQSRGRHRRKQVA